MKLHQILYQKKCVLFFIVFIASTICNSGIVRADELKEGQVAVDFSLKDTRGNVFSLNTIGLKNKVVIIFYDEPESREVKEDAIKTLFSDARIDRQNQRVIVIANITAIRLPEYLIVRYLKRIQNENTHMLILVDRDNTIQKLWGLESTKSDIVVLDKHRVCRYRYTGKLSNEEIEKLVKTIQIYQTKE